jgi:hypothetical protein
MAGKEVPLTYTVDVGGGWVYCTSSGQILFLVALVACYSVSQKKIFPVFMKEKSS